MTTTATRTTNSNKKDQKHGLFQAKNDDMTTHQINLELARVYTKDKHEMT